MTGIGNAVARAAQVLRTSHAKSKVIILLTDGEENVATAETPDEIGPSQAATMCKELGVRAYTITAGIGTIDTTQVEQLAVSTGGQFFAARDANAVDRVYELIDRLEKAELEEARYEVQERFLPFLIFGVVLLLLGRLLGATVFEVLP